jgi:hypothetical protein
LTAFTVGTWNCRMGIDRKREAIERLGCDVLVVPECNSEPALTDEPGVSFAWKGRYPVKGLGVFGFGGWRLEPAEEPVSLPWILPLRVIGPAGDDTALLLAIWTVANTADRWPSYAGQVAATIEAWRSEISSGRVIVAGDTNCSPTGAASARHHDNLRALGALGMQSAFHLHNGVVHGEETEMTLRWFGRGSLPRTYHCDYVFLSSALAERLTGATVGGMEEWVESGLSDHVPVVVTLGS